MAGAGILALQLRSHLSACTVGRSVCIGWTSMASKLSTQSCLHNLTQGFCGNQSEKRGCFNHSSNLIGFNTITSRNFSSQAEESYYDILEVSSQATGREIKNAYLKLSKVHHPDRNIQDKSETAGDRFQAISEAYETLSNPDLRSKYDRGVLGRTSSVADREKSSHRFENEAFYGSRSGRNLDANYKRELDDWITDNRSYSFRKLQNSKSVKRQNSYYGGRTGCVQSENRRVEKSNANFAGAVQKIILYPLFCILCFYFIIKNA
eukprot:TRINITY_DN30423_c0_g1_i1.p1 TRINITY_DN30423_c0_g1~~TRINITY_DN30423_c0_g1_i1.p1  ORF type:complete len:264 (-),score=15.66 TRINITY_DN30423_c0_g1_i1:94-885(-)